MDLQLEQQKPCLSLQSDSRDADADCCNGFALPPDDGGIHDLLVDGPHFSSTQLELKEENPCSETVEEKLSLQQELPGAKASWRPGKSMGAHLLFVHRLF